MKDVTNLTERALLIIDLQAIMFDPTNPVYQATTLLAKVQSLIERAHHAALPVIYIQHNGKPDGVLAPNSPAWQIQAEIFPKPDELVVQKHFWDAFQATTLDAELSRRGIKELIVAGCQTEFCVDTTCRRAFSLGYQVTLLEDAHSTWNGPVISGVAKIAHHNNILGGRFVRLAKSELINF